MQWNIYKVTESIAINKAEVKANSSAFGIYEFSGDILYSLLNIV